MNPSPIEVINELMRLSNLPIDISLEEGQKIVARKNEGDGYSVAELSDGERNAFLIAAEVLTAKPGTLILVDEPERHLHRSIISPLLRLLFYKRRDCAFVVSTHELMLPADTPEASTMLVRGCQYQGQDVQAWTVDLVPPGAVVDDDLKRDLLGARRKILFVEGVRRMGPAHNNTMVEAHKQPGEARKQGVINQALLRVRLNYDVYEGRFFKHLFRSGYFQRRIFDSSTGTAIPNVKGVNELKAITTIAPTFITR